MFTRLLTFFDPVRPLSGARARGYYSRGRVEGSFPFAANIQMRSAFGSASPMQVADRPANRRLGGSLVRSRREVRHKIRSRDGKYCPPTMVSPIAPGGARPSRALSRRPASGLNKGGSVERRP